jgi:hypothetical protein
LQKIYQEEKEKKKAEYLRKKDGLSSEKSSKSIDKEK